MYLIENNINILFNVVTSFQTVYFFTKMGEHCWDQLNNTDQFPQYVSPDSGGQILTIELKSYSDLLYGLL